MLTAVTTWLRWVRPRIRRTRAEVVAIRDSILGREPITDSITGREIEPALPGVGIRLENLEVSSISLADAIGRLADSHVRLDNHEDRIKRLELGTVERIVTRSESAAAWRAMEAVATPDESPDLD